MTNLPPRMMRSSTSTYDAAPSSGSTALLTRPSSAGNLMSLPTTKASTSPAKQLNPSKPGISPIKYPGQQERVQVKAKSSTFSGSTLTRKCVLIFGFCSVYRTCTCMCMQRTSRVEWLCACTLVVCLCAQRWHVVQYGQACIHIHCRSILLFLSLSLSLPPSCLVLCDVAYTCNIIGVYPWKKDYEKMESVSINQLNKEYINNHKVHNL